VDVASEPRELRELDVLEVVFVCELLEPAVASVPRFRRELCVSAVAPVVPLCVPDPVCVRPLCAVVPVVLLLWPLDVCAEAFPA